MSFQHQNHSYSASTAGDSVISSFLTPPITPQSDHDIPYCPRPSDDNSLTMKRRHHSHDEPCTMHCATVSASNSGKKTQKKRKGKNHIKRTQCLTSPACSGRLEMRWDQDHSNILQGEPLFTKHRNSAPLISPADAVDVIMSRDKTVRTRRWTLPCKSEATCGLTPLRSTVTRTTLNDSIESPAMITLRRATTNRSPKRNELTFFPEPEFGSERNNLLSYLVSTFSYVGSSFDTAAPLLTKACNSRSASVTEGGAHPASTCPAASVCTETTVDANFAMPDIFDNRQVLRRCSTKYVTGEATYEIIWDENDSSSTTNRSSKPSMSERRSSAAVAKLESQLARSDIHTRRASDQSGNSRSRKSSGSVDQMQDRGLTHDKLEQLFPRLLYMTGFRDLPRSRSGGKQREALSSMLSDQVRDGTPIRGGTRKASAFTIDFFPPLSSRRMSVTQAGSRQLRHRSMSPASPRHHRAYRASIGSMIGASTNARRRSSPMVEESRRRSNVHGRQVAQRAGGDVTEALFGHSDMEPLLGTRAKR